MKKLLDSIGERNFETLRRLFVPKKSSDKEKSFDRIKELIAESESLMESIAITMEILEEDRPMKEKLAATKILSRLHERMSKINDLILTSY